MLKGVGRVYHRQQFQQAAASLLTCIPVAIRAKSSSAAALLEAQWSSLDAHRNTPRRNEDASSPSPHQDASLVLQQQLDRTRRSKSKVHEPTRTIPCNPRPLPQKLMSMIEALFSMKSQDSMLRYLRSSSLSEHFQDRAKTTTLAQAMVHTRSPHRAKVVLMLAHNLGCSLKQSTYESVAHQLAEGKHWRFIPSLVALAKRQSGRTTVRLLNWRIRATTELANFAHLENVLDEFEAEGLKANRRTYHLLVSGHLRNHNLRLARANLKKMELAGFPADATTHATVLSVYRTLGPALEVQDHAFAALRDADDRMSSVILNNLLQLYIDAHDTTGILRILPLFRLDDAKALLSEEIGIRTTPPDGNGLLDRFLPQAHVLPSHIHPSSINPDAATFTILINYAAARRDLPGTLRLFHRMLAVGINPDTQAVSALLRAYFKAGEEAAAVRFIADMCHEYNVPRSHFVSLGLTSQSPACLPLSIKGIQLTAEMFNALMRNSLNTRSLKGALVVLSIMRYCHVKPDTKTIEIFMTYLDQVKRARPRDLIRVLRNLTSSATHPSLNHVHIIMRSILRREKFLLQGSGWDILAAKFSPNRQDLARYPEGRISGTASSFDPTAGIELPSKLSYRGLIRPIVQSLSSRHIMSHRVTIALRLRHEAVSKSDLHTARAVFEQMLARGMHPTKHHYASLMEGYARSGDIRGAEGMMDSAMQVGIRPNVVMFTILIVGHARRGNPDGAMRTFEGMVAAGIRPDTAVVDAIASAYFAVGAYKIAKRVLLALWPHVQPLAASRRESGASLKRLTHIFRSYSPSRNARVHLIRSLSKYEQTLLRWKIAKVLRAWNRVGAPMSSRNQVEQAHFAADTDCGKEDL